MAFGFLFVVCILYRYLKSTSRAVNSLPHLLHLQMIVKLLFLLSVRRGVTIDLHTRQKAFGTESTLSCIAAAAPSASWGASGPSPVSFP